jgi:hypothetical protein
VRAAVVASSPCLALKGHEWLQRAEVSQSFRKWSASSPGPRPIGDCCGAGGGKAGARKMIDDPSDRILDVISQVTYTDSSMNTSWSS